MPLMPRQTLLMGHATRGHGRQIKLWAYLDVINVHSFPFKLNTITLLDVLKLMFLQWDLGGIKWVPLTSHRPSGLRYLSAYVRGLFTEARWPKKEGGRERRMTEMSRKSKDRMTNWVVWDSPAILHQTRNANMHTNRTHTNKLPCKCWSIESRLWIQLLALNQH